LNQILSDEDGDEDEGWRMEDVLKQTAHATRPVGRRCRIVTERMEFGIKDEFEASFFFFFLASEMISSWFISEGRESSTTVLIPYSIILISKLLLTLLLFICEN
jgi:hypothetical protein